MNKVFFTRIESQCEIGVVGGRVNKDKPLSGLSFEPCLFTEGNQVHTGRGFYTGRDTTTGRVN